MGFAAAKRAFLRALREGDFVHEAREVQEEKNLLAIGEVGPSFVARLILRSQAADHDESLHHAAPDVTVHVFRPTVDDERWHVKGYFLESEIGTATFISVHRAE
jgi:hypothetical protein